MKSKILALCMISTLVFTSGKIKAIEDNKMLNVLSKKIKELGYTEAINAFLSNEANALSAEELFSILSKVRLFEGCKAYFYEKEESAQFFESKHAFAGSLLLTMISIVEIMKLKRITPSTKPMLFLCMFGIPYSTVVASNYLSLNQMRFLKKTIWGGLCLYAIRTIYNFVRDQKKACNK